MVLKVISENSSFKVGPSSFNYQARLSGFKGILPEDPLNLNGHVWLNGMRFTTKDKDNDRRTDGNCVRNFSIGNIGGWWYNECSYVCEY